MLVDKAYIKVDSSLGPDFKCDDLKDEEEDKDKLQPSKSIDEIVKRIKLENNLNFFEEICILLKNEIEEQYEENLYKVS